MPLKTFVASLQRQNKINDLRKRRVKTPSKNLVKGKLGDITFQVNPSKIEDIGGRLWGNIESAGLRPIPISGGWQPRYLKFELLFHKNIFIDVDIKDVIEKLKVYRNSAQRIKFSYGGFLTVECWVVECPFIFEDFYYDLSATSIKVPVTIQLKEV